MIVAHPQAPPCFEEIDEALQASTTRTVVLGARSGIGLRASDEWVSKTNLVVYNFDYPETHFECSSFDGLPIWDFSARNLSKWYEAGRKDVEHVPVGYHPSMKRFARRFPGQRDIDVAFFGSKNPRRSRIMQALKSFGYRTYYGYGESREVRDNILARCRVGLNMLYYEDGVCPSLRAAHLLANQVPMVSELAAEPVECLWFARYQDLVAQVRRMLSLPDFRLDEIAEEDHQHFRDNRPLTLPR